MGISFGDLCRCDFSPPAASVRLRDFCMDAVAAWSDEVRLQLMVSRPPTRGRARHGLHYNSDAVILPVHGNSDYGVLVYNGAIILELWSCCGRHCCRYSATVVTVCLCLCLTFVCFYMFSSILHMWSLSFCLSFNFIFLPLANKRVHYMGVYARTSFLGVGFLLSTQSSPHNLHWVSIKQVSLYFGL